MLMITPVVFTRGFLKAFHGPTNKSIRNNERISTIPITLSFTALKPDIHQSVQQKWLLIMRAIQFTIPFIY